jgi:ElaB/YqjD/DUF883 family membrane-anchored ribosome-binding protein
METPAAPEDNAPDSVAEADERVERARESLSSRIDELGRRFRTAKNMGNLSEKIAKHPWPAVGIAVALGAFAGLAGHLGRPDENGERKLRQTLFAGAGALLLRLAKSYAMGQLADSAKSWIDERSRMDGAADSDKTEKAASRDPSVEAFLQH